MRLVDVAASDGSRVNPDYVVKVVPEGTECWLYLSWGDRLWCYMSAQEVAKALQGQGPTYRVEVGDGQSNLTVEDLKALSESLWSSKNPYWRP